MTHSFDIRRRLLVLATLLIPALPAVAAEEEEMEVPGIAPGAYEILDGGSEVRLPFEFYRGDIRLQGQVNGHDVHLLVDNGFLWDQVLFWGGPDTDVLGLEYDGEIEVGGGGDGDVIPSYTASGLTVAFPGIVFTDQPAIVMPYESGTSSMWEGSVGQVSALFFKNFVVTFDVDAMVMTLTEPDAYTYDGPGRRLPMIHTGNNSWAIPGKIETLDGRIIEIPVTMDLGMNDWLQLTTEGEHMVGLPAGAQEASLGFGVQGEIRGYVGRLATVEFAGYRIDDLLTEFVPPENEHTVFHEGMLGLNLLKMFNFVYDYPGECMYLAPSRRFGESTERDMTGARLARAEEGFLVVRQVQDGSPAAEAGLVAGDEILGVDGRPAADYDFFELRPLLRRAGAEVTFTVRRDGQERQVVMALRRLI
ncbi:MAG: PDZ domain-containing protein [bacterium]|nr:PDZ domain-containing protein [bacterium]